MTLLQRRVSRLVWLFTASNDFYQFFWSLGSVAGSPSADFKPTRRVRELPGGPRTNIFADEDVPDALSMAPPKAKSATSEIPSSSPVVDAPAAAADEKEEKTEGNATTGTGIKPSRCVRQ